MRRIVSFLSGLLLGLGLLVSDMADPARVQAFLDLLGAWDPTLAFVMAGAMAVSFVGWRIAATRPTALLGGPLPAAPSPVIDRDLVLGSAIFGIGWGLAGICPGPGILGLATGRAEFLIFFASMVVGIALWNAGTGRTRLRAAP
ncbi:MAG TPA: DUF6691 family protein [Paracoccaceae bacterium]|nr:DUF6691 family protein [Paracoccaceae bacterium]